MSLRTPIQPILVILLAIIAPPLVALLLLYSLYGSLAISQPTPLPQVDEARALEADYATTPITIALLGYGGGVHDGGQLTDTIILAQVHPAKKLVTLVSVPRDLWVPLPVNQDSEAYYKINAAYAIGADDVRYPNKPVAYRGSSGGGVLATAALEQVTGVKPDYYVAVSFDGFLNAIDSLGGVTVDVPVAFVDPYYPITGKENDSCGKSEAEIQALMQRLRDFELERQFECRYEQLQFAAGEQRMDATTALKFVRSRHSGQHGSDFSRSQRQQALMEGVKNELLSFNFLTKVVPLLQALSRQVDTNIDFTAVRRLYGLYQQMQDFSIQSVQLTTENVLIESRAPNGAYILIPKAGAQNWSGIHQFVTESLNAPVATPTATMR